MRSSRDLARRSHELRVDPFQDEIELAWRDLDTSCVRGDRHWHAKETAIEAAIEQAAAATIVSQQLHAVRALVVEEEGMSGARFAAERITHDPGKASE